MSRGHTHLILDPIDFLRRLAALVFPYTHQVRDHGIPANRSGLRRFLPSPPSRPDLLAIEAVG